MCALVIILLAMLILAAIYIAETRNKNRNRNDKSTADKIVSLAIIMLLSLAASAQEIKGTIKDETGGPIVGATVNLVRIKDSAIVKLAVTRPDGGFSFANPKPENYFIRTSHVGFKTAQSANFQYADKDLKLPDIIASRGDAAALRNVTVTVTKPLVEVKADKMILNVEGTINATGSNALELLRKSPGILLDKDDNISMAGKTGVQVYIDNRSTPLSGQELANYLKSLQSSQIEAIELITNPSAKYDAAGNAGIINIRLKKNKSLGTNGSVNAGWNIGRDAKYNGGASLNHRNQKLNIFSNYSFNYSPNKQSIKFRRTITDSLFDQSGFMFDVRKSHNFKAGADYSLNKQNTLGLMVNGNLSDPNIEGSNKTYISNTNTGIVDRVLLANNTNDMKRHNLNLNLNYNYVNSKGTSLAVNADRGSYDFNSNQYQANYYYDPAEQTIEESVIYHMLSPAKINIHSVKADYEQNLAKGKLGFGAKSAIVKTDNDFQRYNVYTSGEILDLNNSDHFIYKENIHAAYVNYNRQLKKVMIQAGVRAENTVSEGDSKIDFKRSYTDFFPSAAITFNKNPQKQWSLTYSRRIDRPAYQDLNPFEFKLDEYTYMKGNVNLRPQYTNSFGLSHMYKFKLNLALNYSHVSGMFVMLFDTIQKSRAFLSKKNLAEQDIINLTVSYPYQYKNYSLFASATTNYSMYKADFGTGRTVDLNAFGFNFFAQNSLKFKKTWTAELSGFFNAPTVYMGSFKGEAMYSADFGISKQCDKATIKASVSDIFHSIRFRATSDFAGQTMKVNHIGDSRQLKLSLVYRFGNSGVKPVKQRTSGAEDELKRTNSGGLIGN